jgi:hypothetical protein
MVKILRLTVAYLNATINVKPETQNRRLEPTGLAKPGETRGLTGTGPGLARQESAGRVFGRFWNRTDPFLRSKPGPLAGYPDPLLTLVVGNRTMHVHTRGGWQHNGVIIPDWGNIVCDQDLVTMYHIIISNNVTPELVWKIIWLSCFCILTSPHGRLYQFTIHLLLRIFTYVVLNMYS